MANRTDASNLNELVRSNPQQQPAPEVIAALSSQREARLELVALQNQNPLTPEVRKTFADSRAEIYRAYANQIGLDVEKLLDIRNQETTLIIEGFKNIIKLERPYDPPRPPMVVDPPKPQDNNFWYWQTFPFITGFEANWLDGLKFFGGPNVVGYNDDLHARFGAFVYFSLQHDRLPDSPTGWYTSSPPIELFGGLLGRATEDTVLQGKGEATCDLVLRHTVYQPGFGGKIIVAQAERTDHLIDLANGDTQHLDLPGLTSVPTVRFNKTQLLLDDLWAIIEVRFEIYVKSAGSLVWCDPDVLLLTPQWPLVPGL